MPLALRSCSINAISSWISVICTVGIYIGGSLYQLKTFVEEHSVPCLLLSDRTSGGGKGQDIIKDENEQSQRVNFSK